MPRKTSDGSRRKDDRGAERVRVYVTRNGGRYVKANELMESAAAKEAIAAMKAMEERDLLSRHQPPNEAHDGKPASNSR